LPERIAQAGFPLSCFEDPQKPRRASTLEYEEHGLKYEDLVASWLKACPNPSA
jgi:hypothetical protein